MPRVAVVGRPNVGKSSLVNRILGQRAAIVEERPGVTRDRRELVAEWNGRAFVLIDTGGWLRPGESGLTAEPPALAAKVTAQAEAAMPRRGSGAARGRRDNRHHRGGCTRVARVLQRGTVPVIVVVNKVDGEQREVDTHQFMRLGLGEPWAVSAIHGRLSGELLDAVVAALPEPTEGGGPGSRRVRTRRHLLGRDRRSAECREVDAVQSAGGGGALGRARPSGHDARCDRHSGGE